MDKEQIKKELQALIEEGQQIHCAGVLAYNKDYFKDYSEEEQKASKESAKKIIDFRLGYQSWYSKAFRVVSIFDPDRLEDFEKLYTGGKHIKKITDLDYMTAGITHYIQQRAIILNGKNIDFFENFNLGVNAQRLILMAIGKNIDHALFNLESDFQYGVSKSELDVAKELKKNKHLRAAGAVAGVVIEVHLRTVATNRKIPVPKTSKISIYNEKLKGKAYDATITKQIELCSIIRNKCAHASDNPPTDDEINTIISIAEKIIATVN